MMIIGQFEVYSGKKESNMSLSQLREVWKDVSSSIGKIWIFETQLVVGFQETLKDSCFCQRRH